MWQNCISSPITFWVLIVLDVVLVGLFFYGLFLFVKDKKSRHEAKAENKELLEFLINCKKEEL